MKYLIYPHWRIQGGALGTPRPLSFIFMQLLVLTQGLAHATLGNLGSATVPDCSVFILCFDDKKFNLILYDMV